MLNRNIILNRSIFEEIRYESYTSKVHSVNIKSLQIKFFKKRNLILTHRIIFNLFFYLLIFLKFRKFISPKQVEMVFPSHIPKSLDNSSSFSFLLNCFDLKFFLPPYLFSYYIPPSPPINKVFFYTPCFLITLN